MEERMRFLSRLLEGEEMSFLCREFGISRKTGYKIFERYKSSGSEALSDRSRRPFRNANRLPAHVETEVVALKRSKPHWGARKLRELLARKLPGEVRLPAVSTIHAVLDRHGLVEPMKGRRPRAQGTPLSAGERPNDLWCADFKGEFMLGDRRMCYPLTVTDHASRYLLMCEALESVREETAVAAFESLFRERGLPRAVRSDNGVPFAFPSSLFRLSRLSVWWLRLGISIERIAPGKPQQNGRHERMHLTLKKEAARPSEPNALRQQERFDRFVREFNDERPHEALSMRTPSEVYKPSERVYRGLPELDYPFHDMTLVVASCGRLCFKRTQVNVSQVFGGQPLGLKEVEEDVWLVSFMDYDLGYIDLEKRSLQPLDNPFGPKRV